MDIIRYAELKAHPWRKGGGVTREVARHSSATQDSGDSQDGAGSSDGWDWRVSIADVSKAGEFSAFPGMDRVLTVVEGELLLLSVDGAEHPLEKYRPFRFSGDAAAAGALPTGDIRDLNVITRRDAFKGYTSIIELSKKRAHPVFAGQLGILLQGQAAVAPGGTAGAEPTTLERYDAVVGSDTASPEILGRGFLAVVSIDAVAS
ncbi:MULTISPECIES: HutD/Ves family protein [unclassified Arthrobacter]|uniref:HutD/Ves family protein n=1 Tax=unclassified Arthrobacter TaxID=235627 RepID=UPI002E0527ED|nr:MULTISPECIES: HutD family protein [unclassified Arthrobacter]MEC5191408.1 environmental stress-induced protein Ves [Arthrobacter sp. MP_M4]MEC5202991.1 environmental stress-induced protein Ves [Arthrobacter sp. MP_M7]